MTVPSVILSSAVLFACGSAALRAAEDGDYPKLRAAISEKHARGKLTNDEAAELARAVAEREIATAKNEAASLARLRETRACAGELEDALEARMKKRDGAGAEAALELLEDGKLSESHARDWLDDPDDRWRAVGARTLDRDDDRERRHRMLVDPSPRVRRSAIHASAKANDPSDLDRLFEVARVDPELLLRNEAIRASSAILRGVGDSGRARAAELAIRLRDLWTSGDDAVREDVAVAWALSPVWENGGREALRVVIGEGQGPGALTAAGVVARSRRDDAELVSSSTALVARAIDGGAYRERLQALAIARLDPPVLEATRKAAKDEDPDVRIPALARLLESKPDRDAATRELEAIAGRPFSALRAVGPPAAEPQGDGRAETLAARARDALASAGDLRIQAWIERDLAAAEPNRRMQAASALAALGRSARAAPLLADADPSVRTRAACTMIVAARRTTSY